MRCASRSLSAIFPETYSIDVEGSLPDLVFFSILIVLGLIVLSRRKVNWTELFSSNAWILLLYALMLVSVLWSDTPVISLKRWIRIAGDLINVLVVLTEEDPLRAITTIFRRCFILLIPLSIALAKYFPDIGRLQSKTWEEPDMWIGVATHKNALAQLSLLSGFYFIWDLSKNRDKRNKLINILYLLMTLYLLNGGGTSRSVTCIVLLVIALAIYALILRYKHTPARIRSVVLGAILIGISLLFIDKVVLDGAVFNSIIEMQGRDPSLTGRTELWRDVIALGMKRQLLGYGFGGFWTPQRTDYFKNLHPWGPQQAHDGYIEIFINVGWVGLIIFILVAFAALTGALRQCKSDFEYGLFRLILLIVALIHNYSESGFIRPTHLIWFVFLLMAVNLCYVKHDERFIYSSGKKFLIINSPKDGYLGPSVLHEQ